MTDLYYLKYGPPIHFVPFISNNEVVLGQYGDLEYGIWLYHAINKCSKTAREKVRVWEHCLGHKSGKN